MVGDQIAQKAFENNWSGIFINGHIRDVEVIKNISLGVYAKSPFPMKTDKSVGIGTKDEDIKIGSVVISSGDWIYVDTNGWVVSKNKLEL
jgi:regulator of ribonuclease activity A